MSEINDFIARQKAAFAKMDAEVAKRREEADKKAAKDRSDMMKRVRAGAKAGPKKSKAKKKRLPV